MNTASHFTMPFITSLLSGLLWRCELLCVLASKVVWKRAIQGVREMCDACDATLFNVHWTCGKCGFAVCADCYRAKRVPPPSTAPRRESVEWMTCSANRQNHEPDSLISTQIIPSDGNCHPPINCINSYSLDDTSYQVVF